MLPNSSRPISQALSTSTNQSSTKNPIHPKSSTLAPLRSMAKPTILQVSTNHQASILSTPTPLANSLPIDSATNFHTAIISTLQFFVPFPTPAQDNLQASLSLTWLLKLSQSNKLLLRPIKYQSAISPLFVIIQMSVTWSVLTT